MTKLPAGVTVDQLRSGQGGVQRPEGDIWALSDRVDPVSLAAVLAKGPPISVLVFTGGAHAAEDRLWCGDSEAEMELWKKLRLGTMSKGARLLGIACPPVYGDGGYGNGREKFFDSKDTDQLFLASRADFIKRTRDLLRNAGDPFEELFFDLRFRCLLNRKKDLPKNRSVEPWEGCFKAPDDAQAYGTPTIWILSRDGEVMCEPFWGNNYPDKIRYRYEDVAQAIEEALQRVSSRRSN